MSKEARDPQNLQTEVNCIGYAMYRLGLQERDIYQPLPSLLEILNLLDEALDPSQADAVIIVRKRWGEDPNPKVIHAAIIESDGIIAHRRGYNEPITKELFEAGLRYYLYREPSLNIVYLTRKKEI